MATPQPPEESGASHPPPPPPPPPGGPPPGMTYAQQPENAPGAVAALVLGILSIVICAPCGPFAIWQGRKAEALADQGHYGGVGMAKAGWIMGIIGTIFLVLGILWVLFVVVLAVGSA